MVVYVKRHLVAAVLAAGVLLGLGQAPADAASAQPAATGRPDAALVQTVQYYPGGPGYAYRPYYGRPYPRFYARHFYGRPFRGPGFYRHGDYRPNSYRHGYSRHGYYR